MSLLPRRVALYQRWQGDSTSLLAVANLTSAEQRLCEAAAEGRPLNLCICRADDDDPSRGSTWGADRQIRGQLLYQLLSGQGELDTIFGAPLAVRIQGAAVLGPLRLSLVTLRCPLELLSCHLADGLDLTKARGSDLNLRGSHLEGALSARRLSLDHDLTLTRCTCHKIVNLSDAHISGDLYCSGTTLASDTDPALHADGLTVDGNLFLTDKFTASSHSKDGAVRLLGAHIGNQLACDGAIMTNQAGPALHADGLTVDGGMFLRGITATGHSKDGAVRLLGAHINGQLSCSGAQLTNRAGPALLAERLTVDGNLFFTNLFTNKFTATGHGDDGTIRLLGAHIGGQLGYAAATLTNQAGPALHADGLAVDGGMFLRGITATGHSKDGTIRLVGAHIGNQLDCTDAQLTNQAGPALHADGLTVDGEVFLREGFTAIGHGKDGAVRLPGAHISGEFACADSTLSNRTGPLMTLADAELGPLVLAPGFEPAGVWSVDLSDLTYRGIPTKASLDWWLELLWDHTPDYAAQPWQQLAAVHRAAGHERDARRILIAQQDDRRRRLLRPASEDGLGRRASLWAYRSYLSLLKLVVGYGYQTWRALIALLLILTAAASLGLLAGHIHINATQYVAGQTKANDPPGATATTTNQGHPCSTVEQIGLGVDLGLPLIKTNMRAFCDLDTTTAAGQWITAAHWTLQILSWAAATLVIAGYTGVVRRT